MKKCSVCGHEKPEGEFYLSGSGAPANLCKDCHKVRMKIRRLTNPRVQEYDRERYHRADRKEKTRISSLKWRADHPDAYKAQTAVNNALRDRRLVKMPCVICGSQENVQGHHQDYSRPLDVKWLCAKCHHRLHATFPQLGGHFGAST